MTAGLHDDIIGRPPEHCCNWTPSGSLFSAYIQSSSNADHEATHVPTHHCALVIKLTRHVVDTYRACNPNFTYSEACNPRRYLTIPHVPFKPASTLYGGWDNVKGDLILAVSDVLINGLSRNRYIVKDMLGRGTYGQVVKCWAVVQERFVAVKIIKNKRAYHRQALVEIDILQKINFQIDPDDKHHIVRTHEHFLYCGHLCIVFELLSVSLFELREPNRDQEVSLNLIRLFTKQIIEALEVLHDVGLIHCDLKPENILLASPSSRINFKLIDFGCACWEGGNSPAYIQTRFYRAPEVVIGHQYTTAIDMWSLGCVIAELFLGKALFPGESSYDLLQQMIQVLGGQPPDHILQNAKDTSKYFKHSTGEGQHSAYRILSIPEYESMQKDRPAYVTSNVGNLEDQIMSYGKRMSPEQRSKRLALVDFLRGLLNWDPSVRWTSREASQHPFVTGEPFTGPFQPQPGPSRMPIRQGMGLDQNFYASYSPRVNSNTDFEYSSPQYPGCSFSPQFNFSSNGSFDGNYSDSGQSSLGSYGDTAETFMNHQMTSNRGNIQFGVSPDTWARMGRIPPNAFGNKRLGFSPACSSLYSSPSNFSSPRFHFQLSPGSWSTGSPSRYLLSSPAQTGAGNVVAVAVEQLKRMGWRSPGSAVNIANQSHSSGQDTSISYCGIPQSMCACNNQTGPSFHNQNSSHENFFIQATHHAQVAVAMSQHSQEQHYPTGTLGALISKIQETSEGEATVPPPISGTWDQSYREKLLLQNDGQDTLHGIVSVVQSSS